MIYIRTITPGIPDAMLAALDQDLVDQVLRDLATAARAKWIKLAQQELHTSRSAYLAGIQEVEVVPGAASVVLVGMLPTIVEQGMEETDMRTTLLGPNVPVVPRGQRGKHATADGHFYRSIPFRHSTPGSEGLVAPPMGSAYGVEAAGELGKKVYAAAKKLEATKGLPGQKTQWGGRLPAGLAPKLREHHKTDIYAGMVRQGKVYEKATQSQYHTFRTISTRNPIGWIRPATQGLNLADKVGEFLSEIAPAAFAALAGGGAPAGGAA